MLSFHQWKSLAGMRSLAVKGRDVEEFEAVKGTKLLMARKKMRSEKQNFLHSFPSLKKLRRKIYIVTEPS